MEFTTAKQARQYLNKECNVQITVLRQLTADEVRVVAQIASESSEVEKFIQAYTKHTRRLGENNVHLNQVIFGLRAKISKFTEENFPTFVKITKSTIDFFARLAIEQHQEAQEQYKRAEGIKHKAVNRIHEIKDKTMIHEMIINKYKKMYGDDVYKNIVIEINNGLQENE